MRPPLWRWLASTLLILAAVAGLVMAVLLLYQRRYIDTALLMVMVLPCLRAGVLLASPLIDE